MSSGSRVKRAALKFDPDWEGYRNLARLWAYEHAHKVDLDEDDLISEFAIKFLHVLDRYPLVTEKPNFIALWKRACINVVMTRLRNLVRRKNLVDVAYQDDFSAFEAEPVNYYENIELLRAEAPEELRVLVESALQGDDKVAQLRRLYREVTGRKVDDPRDLLSGWLRGVYSPVPLPDKENHTMATRRKTKKTARRAKPKAHPIEEELVEATGLKPKPDEDPDRWRTRLAKAATRLPDSDFEQLSDDAGDWVNDSIEYRVNEKKAPIDFDDYLADRESSVGAGVDDVEEEELDDEAELEEDDEEEQEEPDDDEADDLDDELEEIEPEPEPQPRRGRRSSKSQPKKTKAEGRPKKAPGQSTSSALRELIVLNPSCTKDEIAALAEKQGVEVAESTLSSNYTICRSMLDIIADLGLRLVRV